MVSWVELGWELPDDTGLKPSPYLVASSINKTKKEFAQWTMDAASGDSHPIVRVTRTVRARRSAVTCSVATNVCSLRSQKSSVSSSHSCAWPSPFPCLCLPLKAWRSTSWRRGPGRDGCELVGSEISGLELLLSTKKETKVKVCRAVPRAEGSPAFWLSLLPVLISDAPSFPSLEAAVP